MRRSTAILATAAAPIIFGVAHPAWADHRDAPVPPVVAYEEPVEVPLPPDAPVTFEEPVIHEDDPAFDCRTMGNRICGVVIQGDTYLIRFDKNGEPRGVDGPR